MKKLSKYHHGDLKDALLQAAITALEKHASISLRDLARGLGVSHAAAYAHFPNKEALLAAVAQQGFVLLEHDLAQAARERHPLDAFRAQRNAYIAFAMAHTAHFRVMFGDHGLAPALYPALTQAKVAAYAQLEQAIRACQKAGIFQPDNSQDGAQALAAWSLVHGLANFAMDRVLANRPRTLEQIIDAVGRTLEVGLVRPPSEF